MAFTVTTSDQVLGTTSACSADRDLCRIRANNTVNRPACPKAPGVTGTGRFTLSSCWEAFC